MEKHILDFVPTGRQNAVSMKELAIRIGVDQRTARKLVFEARKRGAIICSVCGENASGYYRPASIDEVRPYIAMQEHRIASAKAALKSAKKFAEAAKARAGNV